MILLGVLLILFSTLGTPLFAVLGGVAWLLFRMAEIDTSAIMIELYRLANSPTLVTIPLFTFAGTVLAAGQSPQRLVRCARALVGGLPGGLALVALLSCAFFTAFAGASGVTIVALGGLLLPLLLQEGYPEDFSLGLLTTCGSLGLLFPPSLPLILYALVARTPIDLLFIAGIVPGVVLLIPLSLFCMRQARRHHVPLYHGSWAEVWWAFWDGKWEVILPPLVVIGIYGGILTVSEVAVVTAAYSLLVTVGIRRELHLLHDVPALVFRSMVLVGALLIILGMALGFTNYLIDAQMPMHILDGIQHHINNRFVFLLALNLFLLLVGCLMDIFSAVIVIVPLIAPIAAQFDVHPLHLGVIFLTNLEIGYSTPPVGLNLFVGSLRFNRPVTQLYRASWPFLTLMFFALLLITFIPDLSLGLSHLLGFDELPIFHR